MDQVPPTNYPPAQGQIAHPTGLIEYVRVVDLPFYFQRPDALPMSPIANSLAHLLESRGWTVAAAPHGGRVAGRGDASFALDERLAAVVNGRVSHSEWGMLCHRIGISDATVPLPGRPAPQPEHHHPSKLKIGSVLAAVIAVVSLGVRVWVVVDESRANRRAIAQLEYPSDAQTQTQSQTPEQTQIPAQPTAKRQSVAPPEVAAPDPHAATSGVSKVPGNFVSVRYTPQDGDSQFSYNPNLKNEGKGPYDMATWDLSWNYQSGHADTTVTQHVQSIPIKTHIDRDEWYQDMVRSIDADAYYGPTPKRIRFKGRTAYVAEFKTHDEGWGRVMYVFQPVHWVDVYCHTDSPANADAKQRCRSMIASTRLKTRE